MFLVIDMLSYSNEDCICSQCKACTVIIVIAQKVLASSVGCPTVTRGSDSVDPTFVAAGPAVGRSVHHNHDDGVPWTDCGVGMGGATVSPPVPLHQTGSWVRLTELRRN